MIQLSPSKLSVFRDCPRCFWDAYAENTIKVERPRGIFPSLPGGMDRIFKKYFDQYRGSLPPELKGRVPGVLFPDMQQLKRWRNWRTGLEYRDDVLGVRLIGALDDCLQDGVLHAPLDYKTKGSQPKDDGSQYYQLQLDLYTLMLESNGYQTTGKAYLVYFWPVSVEVLKDPNEPLMAITFGLDPYELECSIDRAKETLAEVVNVLTGSRPDPNPDCEYCNRYATGKFQLEGRGVKK